MLWFICFVYFLPTGTYGDRTGLTNSSECTFCSGGSYCDAAGLSTPKGVCDPGHYCVSGVSSATPFSGGGHTGTGDQCPAGNYCPINSTYFTLCSPGTYAPGLGYAACLPCPAGKVLALR